MVQGYHTLEEASRILGMPEDELKRMAQKNEIRSFQDRGTLRFRIQDIQEMARTRGLASDAEVSLDPPKTPQPRTPQPGSGPKAGRSAAGPKSSGPKSSGPKSSGPKSSGPKSGRVSTGYYPAVGGGEEADFSLDLGDDESVDIGHEELSLESKPSSKGRSPRPQPGSDSDVRLVADDLAIPPGSDSDLRLVGQMPSTPRKGPHSSPRPRPSTLGPASPRPKSKLGTRPSQLAPPDSGSRIVPMDSDSDVKIVGQGSDEVDLGAVDDPGATDSDIRIEPYRAPSGKHESMLLTEEINLDDELQQAALSGQPRQAKVKAKSKVDTDAYGVSSPFELSDDATGSMAEEPSSAESSDMDLLPIEPSADSSDMDLVPADDGSFNMDSDSGDDFSLELPEESDMSLALDDDEGAGGLSSPSSGVNLADPGDGGLSLEEESSDMDFELSLDDASTPQPALQSDDSSSEFELSLDDDSSADVPHISLDESSGEAAPLEESSDDSEFEFTLDSEDDLEVSVEDQGEDSEFELTLDDSGQVVLEEESGDEEDKDIFETDFEVPALDDESGSQVAALESESDSSDFDLALDDSDIEIEDDDESGSKVVAIGDDEEDVDDAAATVAAPAPRKTKLGKGKAKKGKGKKDADLDDELPDFADMSLDGEIEGDLDAEVEEEEGAEKEVQVKEVAKYMRPAPWGVMPVVFMIPCLVIMIVAGLLGFELTQSISGHRPPGTLTRLIAKDLLQLDLK